MFFRNPSRGQQAQRRDFLKKHREDPESPEAQFGVGAGVTGCDNLPLIDETRSPDS